MTVSVAIRLRDELTPMQRVCLADVLDELGDAAVGLVNCSELARKRGVDQSVYSDALKVARLFGVLEAVGRGKAGTQITLKDRKSAVEAVA